MSKSQSKLTLNAYFSDAYYNNKEIMSTCTSSVRRWILFTLGCFFLLLGILIICFWSDLVQTIKRQQLNLGSDDTTEYKFWKETPIPMYIEFYLYNWSNWQDVVNSSWVEKPSFSQMGPYTYAEKHIRKEVVFNDNNTLTYKTQRIWHFVPEMSNGSLDDEVTTLNVILATVGSIVKYKHTVVKMGVNFFLEEKRINLTVTKTVREFIFDGYDDPMLDLLKKIHLKSIDIPFDKFGWFVTRNNSIDYDGSFNMFDGTGDIRNLGKFSAWNYSNRTKYYPSYCGEVHGTSGELWYPVGDDPSVKVFASDICGSVTLFQDGEDERFDIKGHKYVGTDRTFDNGSMYPEMGCFSPGKVLPSGVRNVSQCKFGAPVFVSYPHFYLADPYYRELIDGMHPNKTEHEFFVSIEPDTGIPIQAHACLQVNIHLEKISRIKLLENVKENFIPVLWFKQYAKINEELASQAKLLLKLPSIGEYTGYGVVGVGCLLLLIFGFMRLKSQWKGTEEEGLLHTDSN